MKFADWIAPRRTALLVVDMQRDFTAAPGAGDALVNAARLAEGARAAGVVCVFTALQTLPETDSALWRERLARRGLDAAGEMNLCREGSAGAAFVGPRPGPGDLVIAKRLYNGFSGTALEAELRARGRDTLVICGLTTECCVEATARDAFEHDFYVFVAGDACAGSDRALHEASLAVLDRHYAILAETRVILRAWAESL